MHEEGENNHYDVQQPNSKRQKTDYQGLGMKMFEDIYNDKDKLHILDTTYHSFISYGDEAIRLYFLKIRGSNAQLSEDFSCACCNIDVYEANERFGAITYSSAFIFRYGISILKAFLDGILPDDPQLQEALKRLLTFMTLDHSALLEDQSCNEVEWAIRVAQHLLLPLSVEQDYTIDESYADLMKYAPRCPCKAGDSLDGQIGDTSFGLIQGWHGRTDIMVNDVTVELFVPTVDDEVELGESAVSVSLPSSGIKASDNIQDKDNQKIIAQTIVFSFLKQIEDKGKLNNILIPGIGITKKKVLCYFYDSEADVLLGTTEMDLLGFTSGLHFRTIVFLWLTLNYRILCSGIPDSMKVFKARFETTAGNLIHNYRKEVVRFVDQKRKDIDIDIFEWNKSIPLERFPLNETLEDLGIKRSSYILRKKDA